METILVVKPFSKEFHGIVTSGPTQNRNENLSSVTGIEQMWHNPR